MSKLLCKEAIIEENVEEVLPLVYIPELQENFTEEDDSSATDWLYLISFSLMYNV